MFAPEIKIEKFEMVDVITTSDCDDDEEPTMGLGNCFE